MGKEDTILDCMAANNSLNLGYIFIVRYPIFIYITKRYV